jgi:hypothetical protein
MKRLRKLLLWTTFCAVSAWTAWTAFTYCRPWQQDSPPFQMTAAARPEETWDSLFDSAFPERRSRPIYPYSVIPGGVYNIAELKQILTSNPLLARHLENFDMERAVLVTNISPRAAYVSYRMGNVIFWTKRKLTIARGETLITDGKHTIRTRCGNDVSDVPMTPQSPSSDPAAKELDTPIFVPLPVPELDPASSSLVSAPFSSPLGSPPVTAPLSDSSAPLIFPPVWIPSAPPILQADRGAAASGVPLDAPAVSVPEPSSLSLLLFGGAVVGLAFAWAKRANQALCGRQ